MQKSQREFFQNPAQDFVAGNRIGFTATYGIKALSGNVRPFFIYVGLRRVETPMYGVWGQASKLVSRNPGVWS
jgi:hypothetical protein